MLHNTKIKRLAIMNACSCWLNAMTQIRETEAWNIQGIWLVPVVFLLLAFSTWGISHAFDGDIVVAPVLFGLGSVLGAIALFLCFGFFIVQPNQAQVLVFLGNYIGSIKTPGFYWVVPVLVQRWNLSLRIRNLNSDWLKVNDAQGSPIEIGAVVVWRVVDSAKAIFDVEDYQKFVSIQCETALRALASRYPYDIYESDAKSLRSNPDEMAEVLREEAQKRLDMAGVEVIETRLTHLAYAPEIAQAMLRRQQATAVIAAKERIVEGAMSMVEMALNRLSEHQVVSLDEERKAAMANNLLVALVSESSAQPIINTGQ